MIAIVRRGTTLIELVVALAVSGLVLLAAHASLGVLIHGWGEARADRDNSAGQTVRLTLESWLRGAVLEDSLASFDGRDGFRDGQATDTLSFKVADAGALYPGPHRLTLWLDDDPATELSGLVAALQPWTRAQSAADTLLVARDATAFEAKYLIARQGVEVWVDEWTSRTNLPYAIAVDLAFAPLAANDGPAPDHQLLALPIVVSVAATRW